MVGCEHYEQSLVVFDKCADVTQETRQLSVQGIEHILVLDRLVAITTCNLTRGIKADVEDVGMFILAKVESYDGILRKVEDCGIADGSA